MPESAEPDPDVTMAKFFPLGVRNGVEEMHAGGMFGDDLAPLSNQLVRRHIYEALYALTHFEAGNDRLQEYLLRLMGRDVDGPIRSLIPNATANAIREFADAVGMHTKAADALVAAGLDGLSEHIELYEQLGADEVDPRMATMAFAMIPDYWEDPELSAGFREMLG